MRGYPSDLRGERFGALTVTDIARQGAKNRGLWWWCRCDCGQLVMKEGHELKRHKKGRPWYHSCGCKAAVAKQIENPDPFEEHGKRPERKARAVSAAEVRSMLDRLRTS